MIDVKDFRDLRSKFIDYQAKDWSAAFRKAEEEAFNNILLIYAEEIRADMEKRLYLEGRLQTRCTP